MSIQITHNDDGSITATCGDDEVTFFPKKPAGGMKARGPASEQLPVADFSWNRPIPPGDRHKAYVYVPVGKGEPADVHDSMPTFHWTDSERLEKELSAFMKDSGNVQAGHGPLSVRVLVGTGKAVNVTDLVSAADRTGRFQPLQL